MNLIDYLKKEIKKTGYPLEIEVSSLLDKHWQFVINADSYFDREEEKLRDIDICAFDVYATGKLAPLGFRAGMVIECKKEVNFAWVFFTRPLDFEIEDIAGQYVDEAQIVTKNTENYQVMEMILGKAQMHYKNMERLVVSYNEFRISKTQRLDNKKRREIFEAQNQLKKYVDCNIEQSIRASPQFQVYPIEISFPCIVFDGLMYEAIIENGDLQLREANHLLLFASYRSPFSIFEKSMLIDVVRKDYFEEYVRLIRKDMSSIKKVVSKNSARIVRRIEDITSLLSSAQTRD